MEVKLYYPLPSSPYHRHSTSYSPPKKRVVLKIIGAISPNTKSRQLCRARGASCIAYQLCTDSEQS